MKIQERESNDPQRRRPQVHCTLCGGALYRGDVSYVINGAVLCQGCLGDYAAQAFAAHRWICGEEVLP